jgi:hypothetical protein
MYQSGTGHDEALSLMGNVGCEPLPGPPGPQRVHLAEHHRDCRVHQSQRAESAISTLCTMISAGPALTWPDEQKYVGEFKNDKPDGQGTYSFPGGAKYVGEIKDGLYNGQGNYTSEAQCDIQSVSGER